MGKICSILLILALVLSFIVVVAPVSAQQGYAELTANITRPVGGQDIMGGDVFTVTANVTNNGTIKAQDVTATIVISGNATLKAGEVATKVLAVAVEPPYCVVNETVEVSWDLVCIGGGTVNITVTPSGRDFLTGGLIVNSRLHYDMVSIDQKKVLEVMIVWPHDDYALNVTDDFEVKAQVKNVSALNATDVELTISIDRYADLKTGEVALRTEGDLDSSETSGNHTWTLECTGDGFSIITVTPSGYVEGRAIPDDALTPDTVTVRQGDFAVANITLAEGWNLVSLPLIPLDEHTEVVLAGIMDDLISVWYWDAEITVGDPWKMFEPGDAPDDLQYMEDGKAYWINMEAGRTLKIAGTEWPEGGGLPPAYDVVVGWNMIGFKSTAINVTVENYLAGTKYTRIYYFENGTWFVISGTAYNSTNMVPGLGYWVAFTEPGTIYPL